jgi:hypothetical protein
LRSIRSVWEGNGRDFPSSLRDPAPYDGDDWMVQEALLAPTLRFTALIDQARAEGRLSSAFLSISDSFDEQGDHSEGSRHYEGRAMITLMALGV